MIYIGYAYIGFLTLLTISAIVLIAYLIVTGHATNFGLAIIVLGLICLALLRSITVGIARPQGLILDPKRYPEIHAKVEALADRIGTARPRVYLTWEMNASAAQIPRWGLFGGFGNTLFMGLPLLHVLTPEAAYGVIAHELGHLSGNHGRFGAWVSRIQRTWTVLYEEFGGGRLFGAWILMPFLMWYQPRFQAQTLAMMREHEFDADRMEAETVGKELAAETTSRFSYLNPWFRQMMDAEMNRLVSLEPSPPSNLLAQVATELRTGTPLPFIERYLAAELMRAPEVYSTHPTLRERLDAIGAEPPSAAQLQSLAEPSAAESFFGSNLRSVELLLSEDVGLRLEGPWKSEHIRIAELRKEQARLVAKEYPSTLDRMKIASLTYDLAPIEVSWPLVRQVVADYPEDAMANLLMGTLLAAQDDQAAEPYLRKVLTLNPSHSESVIPLLMKLAYLSGDQALLARLADEEIEFVELGEVVQVQATIMSLKDTLEPHGLDAVTVDQFRVSLSRIQGLSEAYLVKKIAPTGHALLILVATMVEGGTPGMDRDHLAHLISERAALPTTAQVFVPKNTRAWRGKLAEVQASRVFPAA